MSFLTDTALSHEKAMRPRSPQIRKLGGVNFFCCPPNPRTKSPPMHLDIIEKNIYSIDKNTLRYWLDQLTWSSVLRCRWTNDLEFTVGWPPWSDVWWRLFQTFSENIFAARCLCEARPLPSCGVCPSVCVLRSYILSKRIKIYSKCFHSRVVPPF